jgi:hypothetical protein
MKKNEKTNIRNNTPGWLVLIAGIVLFTAGLLIRLFSPGTIADTRLIEGLGLLLTGWGIVPFVRTISRRKNPVAAHRNQLAESDERAIILRNQAAFVSLMFNEATSSILLVIYSAMTRGQTGFDPIWFALAFLVIAPMLVFVTCVSWLNRA